MTLSAPARPTPTPHREGTRRRVFPGDARVWQGAAIVLATLVVIGAVELLKPRPVYTGTNSVSTRGIGAEVPSGQRLCIGDLLVPAGTGTVALDFMGPAEQPRIEADLRAGGRTYRSALDAAPAGQRNLQFAIPATPSSPAAVRGRLCVRPVGGTAAFGGMAGVQADQVSPTVAGRETGSRVGVWFRPPAGEQRTLISQLPAVAERAALFRPGWVGAWTYWAILLVLTPAAGYGAVRAFALASAGERTRLPLALIAGLAALANGAAFATLTPAFHTPDEPDHAAYVQIVAETGHKASNSAVRGAFSIEEVAALNAVRAFSTVERFDGRPPWFEEDLDRWRELASNPLPRDDGGAGPNTAASHRPGYYLLAAPAYLAARDGGFFASLWAMRLVSALLGAITAACTVLFIRELAPRAAPSLALLGGLLVAFLPQFAFMSGAVNNDAGIVAASAVTLWLAARALRRDLAWSAMLPLGFAASALLLFKATGLALYPAIALAVAIAAFRARPRRTALIGLGAGLGGLLAGRLLVALVDRLVTPIPVPDAGGATLIAADGVVQVVLDRPGLVLSYLWQTFLPPLPFMYDLFTGSSIPAMDTYVREGFASFGWYTMEFAPWVYRGVAAALIVVAVAALVTAWEARHALWRRAPQLVLVVLAIAGVVGGVTAAYASDVPRAGEYPEQGRYAFTALPALAAVAAAAFPTLRARIAGLVLGAMVALLWASQLMLLQRFYT